VIGRSGSAPIARGYTGGVATGRIWKRCWKLFDFGSMKEKSIKKNARENINHNTKIICIYLPDAENRHYRANWMCGICYYHYHSDGTGC
jgi:hypothetical protein